MSLKFKVAVINIDYVKYLHSFEPRVHLPFGINGVTYDSEVPYVGVVYMSKGLTYYAPLTSDKNEIFFDRTKNVFKINPKSNIYEPIFIFDPHINKNNYVASLRIGNAIPIKNAGLVDTNFMNVIGGQKRRFLSKEVTKLSQKYTTIISKAVNCIEDNLASEELDFANDFEILIKAMQYFNDVNPLVIDRIAKVEKLLVNNKDSSPQQYQTAHANIFTIKAQNDFFTSMDGNK